MKAQIQERVLAALPSPRNLAICDMLFREPIVRIATLRQRFPVHYQTAQADVEELVKLGILRELPNQSQKAFYSPEVMLAAYSGPD